MSDNSKIIAEALLSRATWTSPRTAENVCNYCGNNWYKKSEENHRLTCPVLLAKNELLIKENQ